MYSVLAETAVWKLLGIFTAVDLVVLGLVALSLALGYWTGFVWQMIRLGGVLVALWLAWYYHPVVARELVGTFPASVRHMCSAAIVFGGTMLLLYLLFHLLREPIDSLRPQRRQTHHQGALHPPEHGPQDAGGGQLRSVRTCGVG